MKEVQDRIVQYANRYKLTDVDTGTELGIYDFEEVTGTVQQEGTPVNKELFDSINNDINNIVNGTTPVANTVRYDSQTLTDEQKEQARENIGALGEEDIKINLNGSDVSNPSLYAPTAAGTAGQVLISQGANQAPVWGEAQKKDIANATVTLGASLTFNGSAQEQAITSVTLNGETLSEGTDYKVAGNIATDAGNYVLAVMGIGDYTGTLWVDWSIAKAQGSISAPASVDIIGAVGTQKQVTVVIGNGYGDLVVSSSAPDKVTASTAGNVIILESVGEGNATISITLVGNYQATTTISVMAALAYSTLADNTPSVIRYIADNDLGANYWAVGDTYPVLLNGTVGMTLYDNVTVWAYILGFNHNVEVEGEHLIHFGGFKTAQTDGVDICLVDNHYGLNPTDGGKWFNMNHSGYTNSGGWKRCDMRYDILGSTNIRNGDPTVSCATDPVSGTIMAAFPADLRAVMRPATKYTYNTSYVGDTETQDYMPLLAEFEVHGATTYADATEQSQQMQYSYYANGNSKVKYRQSSPSSSARWWLRSPAVEVDTYYKDKEFCIVEADGRAGDTYANYSYGVAPIFFI